MACFAEIKVLQGSVETYARCGGIFNIHLTACVKLIFRFYSLCAKVKEVHAVMDFVIHKR